MDWKAIAKVATDVVSAVNPAIGLAVNATEAFINLHGKEKQDKAIEMILADLKAVETITSKDLLNDPEFEAVLREAVDIRVRLNNLLVKKAAPA